MAMPDLADPQVWISLVTLTFLEIVLGVDNIIFITIASNKLPKAQQPKAQNIGLLLAMGFRVLLIFGISALIAMQEPWLSFNRGWVNGAFSGQSLILIAGGIFLLYKATSEIHHKLEGPEHHAEGATVGKAGLTMGKVITQIALINIVFSFDSILTAVGLTDSLVIMIFAVVASIVIMIVFATPVSNFVNEHPTIQMLGLAFLILIGFMLIAEGAHLAHFSVAGTEIGAVPKGYLYFAIAFSLTVEFLNLRLRRQRKPVQLHGYAEEAVEEGYIRKADQSGR